MYVVRLKNINSRKVGQNQLFRMTLKTRHVLKLFFSQVEKHIPNFENIFLAYVLRGITRTVPK